MFIHSFCNTTKVLLRQRQMFFWALLFPIILGCLFKLALGHIADAEQFERIPVAVSETLLQDDTFHDFITTMEDEGYFEVFPAKDQTLLAGREDVIAYVESEEKLWTKKSGLKETMVESILNAYTQKKDMVMRIMAQNPTADLGHILGVGSHIRDRSRSNMDPVNTFFYTLVGMQVMYGYVWGLYVVYQYEANLSTKAKRNLIAPVKKHVIFPAALSVAWMFNMLISAIFLAFLKLVLSVHFGGQMVPIFGLLCLASLTGVSFGAFLGASNKASMEFKSGIAIACTMLLSYLAGMMDAQVKVRVQEHLPWLNKINPVASITDAIYSLYYYSSMDRFFSDVLCLALVTLALVAGTICFTRGKQYERL